MILAMHRSLTGPPLARALLAGLALTGCAADAPAPISS